MSFVDTKNDIVNISPFDSDRGGEFMDICGLNIQLPQKPSDKHILFSDLPKEEQYWRRLDFPKQLREILSQEEFDELPDLTKAKYSELIKREWFRRKNGIWFYNNGTATYLTGEHYMFLQWSNFDFVPYFTYAQWLWHIHAKACEVDPRCYGQIVGKNRRWGWTSMAANKITTDTSGKRRKQSYIISKTEEDAKDPCFAKAREVFEGWPYFFKVIYHFSGNSIVFDEPRRRITSKNRVKKKSNGIGSSVTYGSTKNNTFDGKKAFRLMLDEQGKLEKPVRFSKLWDVHRLCLFDRGKLIGKAYIGTTVEEMEKGGEDFKKIYYKSDPKKRMKNGRTISGLYKFFISSEYNLVLDKYGMPIIKTPKEETYDIDGDLVEFGSRELIEIELKSRESDIASVNEYKRVMPVTESDMFRIVGGNSINSERLFTQLQYNERYQSSLGIRQGRFRWTGERFNSDVEWIDDPKGRWQICWIPKKEDRNRKSIKGGIWHPENTWLGASGIDPYRVDVVQYGKGSNGSCHMFTRANTKYPSNTCFARYNGRPETLYMCSEEVLMAHIYYGIQALIESQVDIMIRHWEELGFQGYLMKSPPKLTPKGARRRGYGISTSGANVRESMVLEIQTYVDDYVGQLEDGSMGQLYFNESIKDLAEFDINNATKHDDSISFGVGLLALRNHTEIKKTKVDVNKQLVRKFDNRGMSSKPIG